MRWNVTAQVYNYEYLEENKKQKSRFHFFIHPLVHSKYIKISDFFFLNMFLRPSTSELPKEQVKMKITSCHKRLTELKYPWVTPWKLHDY